MLIKDKHGQLVQACGLDRRLILRHAAYAKQCETRLSYGFTVWSFGVWLSWAPRISYTK